MTHSLNLRGVGRQACGQSAGAVPVIVKPAHLLAQHGLEAEPPQPAGQQLARLGEGVALQPHRKFLTSDVTSCDEKNSKRIYLQHLGEEGDHADHDEEQADTVNLPPLNHGINY